MAKYDVTYSCGHQGTVQIVGKISDRDSKLAWYQEQAVCPACYKAKMQAERDAQPKDIAEHTISLPNGKSQVFVQTSDGRYYVKGTSLYYDQAKWDEGRVKAIAAGATITKRTL